MKSVPAYLIDHERDRKRTLLKKLARDGQSKPARRRNTLIRRIGRFSCN